MTQAKREHGSLTPPSIRDLTLRFLERGEEAESLLAAAAFGEVEPHEVSVAFRTEPHRTVFLTGF